VAYALDGPRELGRLRSSTIVVPYDWVAGEPIAVGVTSSTGIETVQEIAAAVETPRPSARGFLGYGIIGFLVGVLPIALGLLWLPSLRRADAHWLAAFMALTAGLLTFLGVEALFEAFDLTGSLPGSLGGPGLVLLGVALSFLTMTFVSARTSRRNGVVSGLALSVLVAVGIGLHNLGEEGPRHRHLVRRRRVSLGTFLIVGFMIHNLTEGLWHRRAACRGGGRAGACPAGAPGGAHGHRRRPWPSRHLDRRPPGSDALAVVFSPPRRRRAAGRVEVTRFCRPPPPAAHRATRSAASLPGCGDVLDWALAAAG
jgi:zinc transporter ZupT